jgi:hypothetical protein
MIYPMPGAAVAATTDVYYAVDPYVVTAFGQSAVFTPDVIISTDAPVKAALVPSPHATPGFSGATYYKVHVDGGFSPSMMYGLTVEARFDPSPEIGPCVYYDLGSFRTN